MYKLPKGKLIVLKILTVIVIFFALISSIVASFFVVYGRTYVNGNSMSPTLNVTYKQSGKRDVIYINRFSSGKVGDIVVLDLRKNNSFGDYAVKRLVAVGGDVVNIVNNNGEYDLVVNGQIINYGFNKTSGHNTYNSFVQYVNNHKHDTTRIKQNQNGDIEGVIVKSGEIYVLGDNWECSVDSSLVGPISKKVIVGRVDIVVKPKQCEILTILKRIF